MPRINLGLGKRVNVKSSLTKVDLKSKCAELPASWLSQRGGLHHGRVAVSLKKKEKKKIEGRRNLLDQNDWELYDRNEMCNHCCHFVLPLH